MSTTKAVRGTEKDLGLGGIPQGKAVMATDCLVKKSTTPNVSWQVYSMYTVQVHKSTKILQVPTSLLWDRTFQPWLTRLSVLAPGLIFSVSRSFNIDLPQAWLVVLVTGDGQDWSSPGAQNTANQHCRRGAPCKLRDPRACVQKIYYCMVHLAQEFYYSNVRQATIFEYFIRYQGAFHIITSIWLPEISWTIISLYKYKITTFHSFNPLSPLYISLI